MIADGQGDARLRVLRLSARVGWDGSDQQLTLKGGTLSVQHSPLVLEDVAAMLTTLRQGPAPAAGTPEHTLAEKTRKTQAALDARLPKFRLPGVPFNQGVEQLREVAKLELVVNFDALMVAGADPEQLLTLELENATARQALGAMLSSLGRGLPGGRRPAYTVDDGVISVSTTQHLEARLVIVHYSVADLARSDVELRKLMDAVRDLDPNGFAEVGTKSSDRRGWIAVWKDRILVGHHRLMHDRIAALMEQRRAAAGR